GRAPGERVRSLVGGRRAGWGAVGGVGVVARRREPIALGHFTGELDIGKARRGPDNLGVRIRTLECEGKGGLRIDELGRAAKRDSIEIAWLAALDRLQELPIGLRIDLAQLVVREPLAEIRQAGPVARFVAIALRLGKALAELVAGDLLADLQPSRAAVLARRSLSAHRTRDASERGHPHRARSHGRRGEPAGSGQKLATT